MVRGGDLASWLLERIQSWSSRRWWTDLRRLHATLMIVMHQPKRNVLETRRAIAIRIAAKFFLAFVVSVLLVLLVEAIAFRISSVRAWRLGGPTTMLAQAWSDSWRFRFGSLPDDGPVRAPLMPPHNQQQIRTWYTARQARPAEMIDSSPGLLRYELGSGPPVPMLPPVPELLNLRELRLDLTPPMVFGSAMVSSENELWCIVDVAVPFRFRLREYTGSATSFPPAPGAAGWRTLRFDSKMFAHNVVFWALVLGSGLCARDVWNIVVFRSYLERVRQRTGRCIGCGYDLRHIKGDRCPECGLTSVR